MTRANDLHDMPSAAVLEQITRWAVMDGWETGPSADHVTRAVYAANDGTSDQFRTALVQLATHEGPSSFAAAVLEAARGSNLDGLNQVLDGNEGLQSLYRTLAQRAAGVDMAEVATVTGDRLRFLAEQTGEAYDTTLLVESYTGRRDVLASSTIAAATATDALRTAAEREHAVHGLDHTDLQRLDQQLARLEQLTSGHPNTAAAAATDPDPQAQWAATVTQITGRDLRAEPGWTTLAATLDRAAAAGWDVAGQLPATVAQAPLPTHGSVTDDLAYRVMDACPDAVPAAPSVAQINGAEAASTGRQREAAERAIRPAPAPDRGPTVGR